MEKILKFLASPAAKGVIRHVLGVAAGYAAGKTWFSADVLDALLQQFDTVFGAFSALAAVGVTVWSVKSKKTDAPAVPPAAPTP